MLITKIANEGKVWAYKNEKGEEVVLGNILYLGKNDNASRYYEIADPSINKSEDIIIENSNNEQ